MKIAVSKMWIRIQSKMSAHGRDRQEQVSTCWTGSVTSGFTTRTSDGACPSASRSITDNRLTSGFLISHFQLEFCMQATN
jgi:hypothetical protein